MGFEQLVKTPLKIASDFGKWLDTQAETYVVRARTARGINGFVFSIRDEERLELRSEVTDYVVEDLSYKNDHIALKPLIVTLRGFVGEVVHEEKRGFTGAISLLESKLSAVAAYAPERTVFQQAAIARLNALRSARSAVDDFNRYVSAAQNYFSNIPFLPPGETAQERAFNALSGFFKARQLLTVETPWGFLDNMVITSLILEQDNKNAEFSDITVTLKQLQFAKVDVIELSFDGRAKEMAASVKNKGKVLGKAISSLQDLGGLKSSGLKTSLERMLK